MEVVVETELQDIYRVCPGVLIVVNKFEYDDLYGERCFLNSEKTKPYNKLVKYIRVLKNDFNMKYKYIIPAGTPILNDSPIKQTSVNNYTYEIKTTGDSLGGDATRVLSLLEDIKAKISETVEAQRLQK